MPPRYNRDNDEEPGEASFNDALNMVERMNKIFVNISFCKKNPAMIHPLYYIPCYEVRISDLKDFWRELASYCDEEERESLERMFGLLSIAMKNILIKKNNNVEFNWKVYQNILDPFLEKLEGKLRDIQFKYGMANPLKVKEYGL